MDVYPLYTPKYPLERIDMMKRYGKPVRKCSIKELCTSKMMNMPCERWISDEECVNHLVLMIKMGIFSLDMMEQLLYKPDYIKLKSAYQKSLKK